MRVIRFTTEIVRPYQKYFYGILVAMILASLVANFRPYVIKSLIDTASGISQGNILHLIGFYIVLQFLESGAWTISDWFVIHFNSKLRGSILNLLTERISRYPHSFFQDHLAGTISAKINSVFENLPNMIFKVTHQFFRFTVTVAISLVLLTQIHSGFAFCMMAWITVFLTISWCSMKQVTALSAETAESKSKIGGYLVDYLANMLDVRCFANQAYELKNLGCANAEVSDKMYKQGRFLMYFYTGQGVISTIYVGGCLVILVYLYQRQMITPGDLALLLGLNIKIMDMLYELSHNMRDFVTNWGTTDQALKMLDLPYEVTDKEGALPLVLTKGEIKFEDVYFHYKGAQPLFNGLSVTIASGQKVGLVGYSGSGKSTFVKLLLRLFDVTQGQILVDDQDIKAVTQESLRRAIGMIPQDPSLFHRTLMDNIRYGKLEATDQDVIVAAQQAYAHEFIDELSKGYESLVGERGVKLSGGQRQRIAIARSFLKNAPILILDEATSQLDSLTENKIQESLWTLMEGKTTLVIAHRLSTLLHMDRILVFDHGNIVQDGTHEQLLAQHGQYKILWEAQIGGFLPEK